VNGRQSQSSQRSARTKTAIRGHEVKLGRPHKAERNGAKPCAAARLHRCNWSSSPELHSRRGHRAHRSFSTANGTVSHAIEPPSHEIGQCRGHRRRVERAEGRCDPCQHQIRAFCPRLPAGRERRPLDPHDILAEHVGRSRIVGRCNLFERGYSTFVLDEFDFHVNKMAADSLWFHLSAQFQYRR